MDRLRREGFRPATFCSRSTAHRPHMSAILRSVLAPTVSAAKLRSACCAMAPAFRCTQPLLQGRLMAEAARAIMPGESLRVRLRVPDAIRAEKLARVLI